ncbi:MAG: hypothetical protein GY820_18915 [Gammaproteobacteria bacterium]|nr:hypothetical protein [Gammaproteobacteria bacterium]
MSDTVGKQCVVLVKKKTKEELEEQKKQNKLRDFAVSVGMLVNTGLTQEQAENCVRAFILGSQKIPLPKYRDCAITPMHKVKQNHIQSQ